MEPVLDVDGLTTHIRTDAGVVRAVDGASLTIATGEAVALVGESGCGKSMTALSIMRLVRPPGRIVSGRARYRGRDLLALDERDMRDLRGRKLSIVFQDPMTFLNPLMRVGDQIVEASRIRDGLTGTRAREIAVEALRTVRIAAPERVVDSYPHQLSGGMRQRVMIAMAIVARPDLLIADEPTTALDVTIEAQILRLIRRLQETRGFSVLFITHDLGVVRAVSDRVVVLYAGRVAESATTATLFEEPEHPYTRGLIAAVPHAAARRKEALASIPGTVPADVGSVEGCAFAPRCPIAVDRCHLEQALVRDVGSGHLAACHLAGRGAIL